MGPVSVSAIITFHSEGLLAHTAIRSFSMSRGHACAEGVGVQLVLVLDSADALTTCVVKGHPDLDGTEVIVETNVRDLALARNVGIRAASGEYICTLDGDDLISRRYFVNHVVEAAKGSEKLVLHPEIVLSFGMYNAFNWQVDQEGEYFDANSLLTVNPWISAAFAHRSVYEETPYVACYPGKTGFGYEDWYWNCETISKGIVHRLAWGSIYFYRRKWHGSLNESSHQMRTVIPKTALFDRISDKAVESRR
jgi:glycosyltransferase involved in cell wall biosynthesis